MKFFLKVLILLILIPSNYLYSDTLPKPFLATEERVVQQIPEGRARVLWVNYEAIKIQIPELKNSDNIEIDKYILTNFAVLAKTQFTLSGEIPQLKPDFFKNSSNYSNPVFPSDHPYAIANSNSFERSNIQSGIQYYGNGKVFPAMEKVTGVDIESRKYRRFRPPNFGRALIFMNEDVPEIDAKGVGADYPHFGDSSNGMESIYNAVKEAILQTIIQYKIVESKKTDVFSTVESLFVIATNIAAYGKDGVPRYSAIYGRKYYQRRNETYPTKNLQEDWTTFLASIGLSDNQNQQTTDNVESAPVTYVDFGHYGPLKSAVRETVLHPDLTFDTYGNFILLENLKNYILKNDFENLSKYANKVIQKSVMKIIGIGSNEVSLPTYLPQDIANNNFFESFPLPKNLIIKSECNRLVNKKPTRKIPQFDKE